MTMVRNPISRPSVASGMDTWPAPTISRIGGGVKTSANTRTFSRNSVRDLPLASAAAASAPKR